MIFQTYPVFTTNPNIRNFGCKLNWYFKLIQSLPQTQILETLDVNCIDISNLDFLTNRIHRLKYIGSTTLMGWKKIWNRKSEFVGKTWFHWSFLKSERVFLKWTVSLNLKYCNFIFETYCISSPSPIQYVYSVIRYFQRGRTISKIIFS